MNRPFSDNRPIGPLIEINRDAARGEKIQFGVVGTSMPNIRKSPLNALFVLDKHMPMLPGELAPGEPLKMKIQDKVRGDPNVDAKRGGSDSRAPIDEQAVIVSFGEDSLPIQDTHLHNIADTIERHYPNSEMTVMNVILDTE